MGILPARRNQIKTRGRRARQACPGAGSLSHTGGFGDHTDKRRLFIESWANELGMTGTDAVGKISSHGTGPEAGE
jgi:hypothetical protein